MFDQSNVLDHKTLFTNATLLIQTENIVCLGGKNSPNASELRDHIIHRLNGWHLIWP